jgi:hypothetical protein
MRCISRRISLEAAMPTGIAQLAPFYRQTTMANVVIETPLGLAVKPKYDEKDGVFRVHKGMPVGFEFPAISGLRPHGEAFSWPARRLSSLHRNEGRTFERNKTNQEPRFTTCGRNIRPGN